jgi:type II secretory ATPase GspE/PulE/Tfp pilus assembly ATPase PilB-like protein
MISTLNRPSSTRNGAPAELRPGQLFNAEDFALADLSPTEAWERIISIAVREQASDVHLGFQSNGMHVALRLDGRLFRQGVMPTELSTRVINHVKVLAKMDVSEKRRPQDGHATFDLDGRAVDLRLSLLPTCHGEDLAVRILDRGASLMQLDQLGVSERQLRELLTMIASPSGLILVTGATGAGKSTTLYAALKHLADGSRKVVTIENPVEYDLPEINQAEVNYRIGVDYASLIRSVLRHDPNVIMIGEIRDSETAETVVRAANCGRLVLATSHAVHSGAAIDGLINLGAHRHFVARSFRGVIAQTLVRRLCPYCTIRLEETADGQLLDDVRGLLGPNEKPVLSMGRGCPHCRHTGYRGRVGVFEIMVADEKMREMIAAGAPSREIYDHAVANRMITIASAGKLAALRGLTTIEELLENISEIWTGGR